MSLRSLSWWVAGFLLLAVGMYLRQEPIVYATGPAHTFQGITEDIGSWRCRPVDIGETTYVDPSVDTAWSGVCERRAKDRLNVYIGYAQEQGPEKRLASPRLHYPANDLGWSYISEQGTEIPSAGVSLPPVHVNETILQHAAGRKDAVLYWYQKGERTFSDEYRYRFSLMVQRLIRRPTDGAIIRISTPVEESEVGEVFREERELAGALYPELAKRFPWK